MANAYKQVPIVLNKLWKYAAFRFSVGLFGPFIFVKLFLFWALLGAAIAGITPAYTTIACDPHAMCNLDVFFSIFLIFAGPIAGLVLVVSEPMTQGISFIRESFTIIIWLWITIFWEFFVFSPAIISPATNDIAFWKVPFIFSFMISPIVAVIFLFALKEE